jgi:hypothetical protein
VLAAGVAVILLIKNWPFTQQAVTAALRDRFARPVQIRSFHKTYFPPGCVAEGVSFEHRKYKDLPPLITVEKLIIKGSYAGLISPQKRVGQVQVIGLHVLVPPKRPGQKQSSVMPLTDSGSKKSLAIGEIATDGALLEFLPKQAGKEPYKIQIHHLILDHVGEHGPTSFRASLLNTEPPGEIHSSGKFGPWNADDPGSTPVSGSYTFDKADLEVFKGISGTLSTQGKYSGTISQIECTGTADVPDFRVSTSSHALHVSTDYEAVVDGTNGDTTLQSVKSHFLGTTVLAKGDVTGHPNQHGKLAAVDLVVRDGRIDDLLRMFTAAAKPAMTGAIILHGKAEVPPGPTPFLRKLRMDGDFGIGGGKFKNPQAQQPINRLTESARGESKKQEEEDPRTILSNLKGHVSVRNGIATLTHVTFNAPGTFAEVEGTYNLLDHGVNLIGVLHTTGKLSDATSGFKAIMMKAINPFLKKKSVTVVPFTIKGTSKNPSFALDFDGKRRL